MEILSLLSKIKGFEVKKYDTFFNESLDELLIILKDYIKEAYKFSNTQIDNINFAFFNGLDLYAERIKYDKESTILLGSNFDKIFDLLLLQKNTGKEYNEYLKITQSALITLLACQKKLAINDIQGALFLINHYDLLFEKFETEKILEPPFDEDSGEDLKQKMMKFIFIIAHELGHIVYKENKLSRELDIINKYLISSSFIGNEELLKNLFMWDNVTQLLTSSEFLKDSKKGINDITEKSDSSLTDYLFSTKEGQSKSKDFFKEVQNNDRLKEELACDLFAINFYL